MRINNPGCSMSQSCLHLELEFLQNNNIFNFYLSEPSVYPQSALLPSASRAPHSVFSPGPENSLLSPATNKSLVVPKQVSK
jgi:hypothetical protein